MSIKDIQEKINPFYPLLVILLLLSIFVGLWKLSEIESGRMPLQITTGSLSQTASIHNSVGVTPSINSSSPSGEVIGSKSGKKYYFPWCGTVKRIKPENQVRFGSIEEAKNAGFVAGGNCKGLK